LVVLFDLGPQRGKGDIHAFSEFAMGVLGRRIGVQNEVYEFATGVCNSLNITQVDAVGDRLRVGEEGLPANSRNR
jgi:hypothetical protein